MADFVLGPPERVSIEGENQIAGAAEKRPSLGPPQRILKEKQGEQLDQVEDEEEKRRQEKLLRSEKLKRSLRKQILPKSERRKTRVELAQEETLRAFGGNSLGNVLQHATPHRGHLSQFTPVTAATHRETKLQKAAREVAEAFPEDLGSCSVKKPVRQQKEDIFTPLPKSSVRKTRKQRAAEEAAALWGAADLGDIQVVTKMSALEQAIQEAKEKDSEEEEEEEHFGLRMVLNYEQALEEIAATPIATEKVHVSDSEHTEASPVSFQGKDTMVPTDRNHTNSLGSAHVSALSVDETDDSDDQFPAEGVLDSPLETRMPKTQELAVDKQPVNARKPAQESYFGFPEEQQHDDATEFGEPIEQILDDVQGDNFEPAYPELQVHSAGERENVEVFSPTEIEHQEQTDLPLSAAGDAPADVAVFPVEACGVPKIDDSPDGLIESPHEEDLSEAAIAKFYENAEASITAASPATSLFLCPEKTLGVKDTQRDAVEVEVMNSVKISDKVLAGLDPDVVRSFGGVVGQAVPNLLSLFEPPSTIHQCADAEDGDSSATTSPTPLNLSNDSWDDLDLADGVCDISLGDLGSPFTDSTSSSISDSLMSPSGPSFDVEASPELFAGLRTKDRGKTPLLPSGKKVSKISYITEMYKLELEETAPESQSSSLADEELTAKMTQNHTCKALKQKLRDRGLKVGGVKAELIARLISDGYTE